MSKFNLTSPFTNDCLYFFSDFLEFRVFDLVFSCKLVNHELTISKCMDSISSDFYWTPYSEEHSGVLCLVICSYSDCLIPCFNFFIIAIGNIYSTARFSRVSSWTTVCIEFHYFHANCLSARISVCMNIRISSIPYRIIARRLSPNPNANPEYFSVSTPPSLRTFGCMRPAPMNSIHPDFLHTLHPDHSQNGHEKSTSTPGSTNGKNPGRILMDTSFPKRSLSMVSIVYLRLARDIFSPTTIPSTW